MAERGEQDRRDGRLLILLGVPFALLGWIGLTGSLWLVQLLAWSVLPWSLWTGFWISAAIALAAMVVDCIVHPVEEWRQANYYLVDGTASAGTDAMYGRAGGAFDGMPLMTSMSDPANWVERERVIASGCSNVVLAGPRHIRQGLAKIALAGRRGDRRHIESAEAFLGWLAERGAVPGVEVAQVLAQNPRWASGMALALELGLARSRRDGRGEIVEAAAGLR